MDSSDEDGDDSFSVLRHRTVTSGDEAAAAAAYALIVPALPSASSSAHQTPAVPLHILQATVAQFREHPQTTQAAGPSQRSGSASSPIALDSDRGSESEDSFASDEDNFYNGNGGDHSAEDEGDVGVEQEQRSRPCVKPYNKAQFPDGYSQGFVCSMDNLIATQQWLCPCPDRHNCIGADRMSVLQLYEFRKAFRQGYKKSSLQDAMRTELQAHYHANGAYFTRSFVVGPCGDCCATSAGLARGMSFQTFANARADVGKGHDRDWHAERRAKRKVFARSTPFSFTLPTVAASVH